MRIVSGAALLVLAAGCGYQERRAELVQMEATLEERGQALSSWADELDTLEAAVRAKEEDLIQRESALKEQREEVETREASLEKLKEEVEKKAKSALRGAAPPVVGRYAIVVDPETGVTLYEKDADTRTAVASTQKLMTSLIVAEAGELERMVTVEKVDTLVEPTKLYIKEGERYARVDLLRALLVRSGNDLAMCLARDNAGSKQAFAEVMNATAIELGMTNSHFVNPHGLTEKGQFSTARDMAKLAIAAYQNPVIRDIVCIQNTEFAMADGEKKPLRNTNRVLREFEPCNGMKTGYTVASGYCLVCSGWMEDRSRIVVVLGSSGRSVWSDARQLLEWALKV